MRPAGMCSFCVFSKSTSALMVSDALTPATLADFTDLPLSVIFEAFLVAKPMFLSKVTVIVFSPKSKRPVSSGVTLTKTGASTSRTSVCASVSWQPVATSATAARDSVLKIFFSFIIQIVLCYSIVIFLTMMLSPLTRNVPPQPAGVVKIL